MVVEAAVLTPLGWLMSPLIKMLIDKAHHHLGTGIDEKRKILAATVLPRLSLAIEKAEKSPNKEKLVDWLRRLKDAYYEAEEAIDLFEYILLKQKVKEWGTQKLLDKQKNMLKGSIDKFIEISKEANEFRDLLEVQENASGNEPDRETTSDPPTRVFGRERDKENIVGLLTEKPLNSRPAILIIVIKSMIAFILGLLTKNSLSSRPTIFIVIKNMIEFIVRLFTKKPLSSETGPNTRPAFPIIAITGRSGVGKTALAQYVYQHMVHEKNFDLCVWMHAPRKFKAADVIKNMIEILKAKESNLYDCEYNPSTSLEAYLTQVRGMLRSKKLLLVIDDLWSDTGDFKDQWKKFIDGLTSCLSGSKILLTTPSINAAEHAILAGVTEVKTYYLEEIVEDDFLDLFMHYAWAPSSPNSQKQEFEKIGRKIAVKLKGDPGAAKLVGHQLSGKLVLKHWEEVAEKDWLGDNMKARIWSYQQLPQHLQRCFAICSLFPKETSFQKEVLIAIWMAEGFVSPTDNQERLEDTSEKYLHELVSSFFLEQVVVNERIYYQLHDLLHDLAERVQGDGFIRIDFSNSGEDPFQISPMLCRSENIRHINLPSSMINELKEKLCLMKNIRTFFVQPDGGFVPKKVLQDLFKHLKKLRVLELPECSNELPNSIGNLKHLRYLHVNGSRPIKKLPDSICKLYHLQMLRLPNCESLPKDFSELISLRHFKTDSETMSHVSDVGRLTSLQSLELFVVRKERGHELHQLEKLNQIRGAMCITGLENVRSTSDAVKANMRNKKHLEELAFGWNTDERDTNNVIGLSTQHVQLLDALQPHPYTSALTLKGFGGDRFPNWLLSQNSLKHLTSLTLNRCDKVEDIPSIHESLPNCRTLKLWWLKNLKKIPSLPPNLTNLLIDHLPQLSYLSEDDLLMKEERKQSKLEVMRQTTECLKLKYVQLPKSVRDNVIQFLQLVKERLEAAIEIFFTSSLCENIFSKIVKFDPLNDEYSQDELLDAWVMLMNYHVETMFNKNEESKLVLPSSLTYLKISSCNMTSDALSSCIQCLVSLSELEISNIQTITTLPPKEVLNSLKNLKSLMIEGCYLLSSLGGIGALTSLIMLELDGCLNLNTSNEPLPSSLERLKFSNCSNVDVILAESNLPVLCALEFINYKNERGVLHVGHLSCLKELTIVGFNGHLEGLNSLIALCGIWVFYCPEINLSSPIDKCTSALQQVSVDNLLLLKLILSNETISSIDDLTVCFLQRDLSDDEVLQSLTSLNHLNFHECNITHLPKNLMNLLSLQTISLENCANLCELEELPRNLRGLIIKDCPSLTEKFNKGGPFRVWFHEGRTIVTFPTEVNSLEQMSQTAAAAVGVGPTHPTIRDSRLTTHSIKFMKNTGELKNLDYKVRTSLLAYTTSDKGKAKLHSTVRNSSTCSGSGCGSHSPNYKILKTHNTQHQIHEKYWSIEESGLQNEDLEDQLAIINQIESNEILTRSLQEMEHSVEHFSFQGPAIQIPICTTEMQFSGPEMEHEMLLLSQLPQEFSSSQMDHDKNY